MFGFVFVPLIVLCQSIMQGSGQCTMPSCQNSVSEYEESLIVSFEEYEHKMTIMHQNLTSKFVDLGSAVNQNIAKGQEEQDQKVKIAFSILSGKIETIEERLLASDRKLAMDLGKYDDVVKSMHNNMSLNFNSIHSRIDEKSECQKGEQTELNLTTIYLNCLSKAETIDGNVRAANEKLKKHDQNARSIYQNVSSKLGNIERISGALQTAVDLLVKKAGEHEQQLEKMQQNLSLNVEMSSESLNRVSENDEKFQLIIEHLSSKLRLMNESVVIALQEHERKLQTILDRVSLAVEKVNEKMNGIREGVNESMEYIKSQDPCGGKPDVCDCSTIKTNGHTMNGVYRIYVDHQNERHYANAFCDMTTGNGGWTVFQRRKDGYEDFYRKWVHYANGFGNPNGEFWLGNDFLHLLTSKRRYRLRIDLEDFERRKAFAEYSTFNISSAADKYKLGIGNYSGNAGDSLAMHRDIKFSTIDQDNDRNKLNCSSRSHGAWWYNWCRHSNLNGFYYQNNSCSNCYDAVMWQHWRGDNSLKKTEMKISHY